MLSPRVKETSKLLPRALSGFTALWQLGSGVVSVAPVDTKGSVDAWGLLVNHIGLYWFSHTDLGGPCCHRGLVASGPNLLHVMSESVVLW